MTEQRHKEAIQKLIEHSGNNECAECFRSSPTYASTTLGIFLCPLCAKLHQKSIPRKSEIVSIIKHKWTKEEVDFMYTEGNKIVNTKYEKYLPIFYHRPRPDDPDILFEQWILAKYVREEFRELSQQSAYDQGTKAGALFKRMKGEEKFQRRKFILSEPEGRLMYFIKYSDKNPKDSILMRNIINVYMVPEKVGNENGMQITYEKDGVRRNLYVFGEDGKSASDWYHAIRRSMARHKYESFPDADVKQYLNTTIVMESWMSKTGPRKHEKFRKRWFSLVGTAIWYYAQPLDAHPLGYIPLGSKTFGYGMIRGFPKGIREEGYGLTIHTPERVYVLNCSNMDNREQWANKVEKVLASCTTFWTKPSVGKLGHTSDKIINLDDVDDLSVPSNTSVFTEMPKEKKTTIVLDEIDDLETPLETTIFTELHKKVEPSLSVNSKTNSTSENAPRKPLFEKNVRAGQTKDGKITSKISTEKKTRQPTIKLSKDEDLIKSGANELRAGSKKYSDDSECSNSEDDEFVVKPAVMSSIPKQTQMLINMDKQKQRMLSSATDEDSDEEVVVLRRYKDEDGAMQQRLAKLSSSSNRFSFPQASPKHLSPRPESPLARPKSTIIEDVASQSGRSTPKKPPRRSKMTRMDSDATSTSSDFESDTKSIEYELISRKHFHFSQETLNETLAAAMPSLNRSKTPSSKTSSKSLEENVMPNLLDLPEGQDKWRQATFTSERRVQGKERKSLKKPNPNLSRAGSVKSTESASPTHQEVQPRPVNITIANNMENSIWFMLFQCEENQNEVESHVTPWLGAEIAEMPASVGPIRLPSEFEIAVIDTAPGGYGLQRTTGPFYAEPGDVWEVDMPIDDGSAPDMYYHEGMETDDGSVMVYSNVENSKNFEIALYKSGRKLFCRKNIKPGDSASFQVQPKLYVVPVDQEAYEEMQGEDIKASEIIPKSSEIDLDFKKSKLKILAKRRGDVIYFSSIQSQKTNEWKM